MCHPPTPTQRNDAHAGGTPFQPNAARHIGWGAGGTERNAVAKGLEDDAQKGGAARDRDARRAIASTVFSGSLGTKAKAQLRDIASALGLPVEGTKKVVVERIQAHLDATPALADHPRFAGLRACRT
ncbi:hypothetical protein HETIRDRAFT_407879 [Heterobasidion irregulare TC 32-1]|uniref:SAP domain-containing protein n=1 Tax=Heterobasidion irregulare (strain TC 32-1) TaxID=747525 RepID=W4KKA9_HETIT|nr:uncharacterized protein HETIRDRAFT_407879 [Heterobasidion irregulare TC 32-1]ETW86154.1 hypothetical protein HETIRDRAFT_407879 [Heterobasidion irregulare TC 32-1]